MNNFLVKITRYWEIEVEAENECEAKELAYKDIRDYDFDYIEIDDLGELED